MESPVSQKHKGVTMDHRMNPFHELYVGETISEKDFVTVFSPYLVNYAEALFIPGNVVLKGVQGSGKSMLLALLKPEVRVAYAEAGTPFPISKSRCRFIGAGINLTHSGATYFGQRPIRSTGEGDDEVLPIFFGDFLNYWVVADILRSIELLSNGAGGKIADRLSISFGEPEKKRFVGEITEDDSWFGYLKGITEYDTLRRRIHGRLINYREFLNYNTDDFPDEIRTTKTTVGVPISATARALWRTGVVPTDIHFFVHVDQYEELSNIEGRSGRSGSLYRRTVNKALASRDPTISYRIGTRGHAWTSGDDLEDGGSKLEEERDYKLIDLDDMLRRKEHPDIPWRFPGFADDVFRRRLEYAGFEVSGTKNGLIRQMFGRGRQPEEKARAYAGTSQRRAVKVLEEWPDQWNTFLLELADRDPLSARLAEAWARQPNKSEIVQSIPEERYPWETRKYWKKERIDQALMQIAGRCGQRLTWSGANEIIGLSGDNILVFLSICQQIWDIWLLYRRTHDSEIKGIPQIKELYQAAGIFNASRHWLGKIQQDTGRSGNRSRFVKHLGQILSKRLFDDKRQSYPGHNGFSVVDEELDADPEVRGFLNELSDYGNLLEFPHTTKLQDRKRRTKWYLNPILCPQFRIPYSRRKEPWYVDICAIRTWMYTAGVLSEPPPKVPRGKPSRDKLDPSTDQMPLFQNGNSDG